MIKFSPLQIAGAIALFLLLSLAGWKIHAYGSARYDAGAAVVQKKWDKQKKIDEAAAAKLHAEANRVSTKILVQYIDRVKIVREKADAIRQQVPIYLPAGLPELPGGFRLLHDAAAANEPIPRGTDAADGAPVSVEAATGTIVDNYGTDAKTAAKLIGLQDWVYAQCQKNPPPEGCVAPYD